MPFTKTPLYSDATGDAQTGVPFDDPQDYATQHNRRVDAKFFLKMIQDEVLALIRSRVADSSYRQSFACASTLAVGDPVYISANNTLTKYDGTSSPIGFVRYKPTTTTAYINHFIYKSGLTNGTAGQPVWIANDATLSGLQVGSYRIGTFISGTEAYLFAAPQTPISITYDVLDDYSKAGIALAHQAANTPLYPVDFSNLDDLSQAGIMLAHIHDPSVQIYAYSNFS